LLGKWAENDPRSAMTYAQGIKHLEQREEAISSVLEKWALRDSDEASHGRINCAEFNQNSSYREIAAAVVAHDSQRALQIVESLAPAAIA
jgi:hypothetical protein